MERAPSWSALLVMAALVTGCSSAAGDDVASGAPVDGPGAQATASGPEREPSSVSGGPIEPVAVSGLPPGLGQGTHDIEVDVAAHGGPSTRRVRLVVPPGDGPFPVVVALHGLTGNGRSLDEQTRLGAAGAERGAVVVLPDGAGGAWNASTTCCEPALSGGHRDAGFVIGLLDEVARAVPIVDGRALVTGFSNGAFLAYRLACRGSDRIAAVAVVAGTMEETCLPSRPVSVLHLHGEDDRVVPFVDDRAPYSPQAASRGAHDVVAAWAVLDGCDPEPQSSPDGRLIWPGCDGGAAVSLVAVPGLGHAWPLDEPQATTTVLDFLLAQPT